MSAKRLLPLVVLLGILIGLAVWNNRQPEAPPVSTALGLVRLLPADVTSATISAFDLYRGDQKQDAVRLRKHEGHWVVRSHFDAPARAATLQAFLEQLGNLQGELRSEHAEILQDYQIDDAQALHLLVYTDNPETPVAHLLAGKGSGRHGFMRRTNDNRVYAVDMNLRAQAGIAGDGDTNRSLLARPWAELNLIEVPQDTIQAVELQTPTLQLRLVRQAPMAAATSQDSVWTVEQPPGGFAVQSEALNRLLSSWRTLKAENVAPPVTDIAVYGLDSAPYRGTLKVHRDTPQEFTVLIGKPVHDASGQRYYVRQGSHPAVYLLPSWTRDELFPALGTLVMLRVVPVAAPDIMALTLQAGDSSWQLERHGGAAESATWRLVATPDVAVNQEAVTAFLESLTTLSAEDLLLPAPPETAALQPDWRLQWMQQDGQGGQLSLMRSGSGEAERFLARRDGMDGAFVLSATTQQQLATAIEALHLPAAR